MRALQRRHQTCAFTQNPKWRKSAVLMRTDDCATKFRISMQKKRGRVSLQKKFSGQGTRVTPQLPRPLHDHSEINRKMGLHSAAVRSSRVNTAV